MPRNVLSTNRTARPSGSIGSSTSSPRLNFSIHDLSRVELDSSSGLPRFNMPLELGADLALRLRGPARHRRRRVLVLDAAFHRYDQTLSDISGMDIEAHGNDPAQMIRAVRDWLK